MIPVRQIVANIFNNVGFKGTPINGMPEQIVIGFNVEVTKFNSIFALQLKKSGKNFSRAINPPNTPMIFKV